MEPIIYIFHLKMGRFIGEHRHETDEYVDLFGTAEDDDVKPHMIRIYKRHLLARQEKPGD